MNLLCYRILQTIETAKYFGDLRLKNTCMKHGRVKVKSNTLCIINYVQKAKFPAVPGNNGFYNKLTIKKKNIQQFIK